MCVSNENFARTGSLDVEAVVSPLNYLKFQLWFLVFFHNIVRILMCMLLKHSPSSFMDRIIIEVYKGCLYIIIIQWVETEYNTWFCLVLYLRLDQFFVLYLLAAVLYVWTPGTEGLVEERMWLSPRKTVADILHNRIDENCRWCNQWRESSWWKLNDAWDVRMM